MDELLPYFDRYHKKLSAPKLSDAEYDYNMIMLQQLNEGFPPMLYEDVMDNIARGRSRLITFPQPLQLPITLNSLPVEAPEPPVEVGPLPEQSMGMPLDLRSIGPKCCNLLFKKLSYHEIGRMEETSWIMKEFIRGNNIKGDLKVFELCYNRVSGLSVFFDKTTMSKYNLIEISYRTIARVHAKVLRIEGEMPPATLKRIKRLLQENGATADKIILGEMFPTRPISPIEGPELYELLKAVKAKELFVNCRIPRDALRHPEIKAFKPKPLTESDSMSKIMYWLKALSIVHPLDFNLGPFLLNEIYCPKIRITWNTATFQTVRRLLMQWKNGTRSIRNLAIDMSYEISMILDQDDSGLTAEFLWTGDQPRDPKFVEFFSIWNEFDQVPVKILLLKRGRPEERSVDDYLILFFGNYRFVAATLDGIAEENIFDLLMTIK